VTAGAGKWDAISKERALADCCAAARVRNAFRFPRDTLDPAGRRGGGWPTGPRARRRDGRPDSRVPLCKAPTVPSAHSAEGIDE